MVVIRLSRRGAKKRAFYNIVVADSRMRRDGRYIERVGFFNPQAASSEVTLKLDRDRVEHWVGQGAQMSDRVRSLVKKHDNNVDLGALKTAKIEKVKAKKVAQAKAAAEKAAQAAAEEAQANAEAEAEAPSTEETTTATEAPAEETAAQEEAPAAEADQPAEEPTAEAEAPAAASSEEADSSKEKEKPEEPAKESE